MQCQKAKLAASKFWAPTVCCICIFRGCAEGWLCQKCQKAPKKLCWPNNPGLQFWGDVSVDVVAQSEFF
eukprot:1161477-Pelagomonas_calceolata.AAC.1